MNFDQFSHITFDCYGTLVDWETGILRAMLPLLSRSGAAPSEEHVLDLYTQLEVIEEALPYRPYRDILMTVAGRIGEATGVTLSARDRQVLPDSIADWPAFDDTVHALQRLKSRFKLVILSNIDDDLFAQTRPRLGVEFDEVITAQQVRAYKPRRAHFDEALRRLAVPRDQILHVAQSLYHDHVPAQELGFSTIRIDRPSRVPGTGLSPQASVQPNLVMADLASVAEAACPP